MSSSSSRVLRAVVCACVIGGGRRALAASRARRLLGQHAPAPRQSSDGCRSTSSRIAASGRLRPGFRREKARLPPRSSRTRSGSSSGRRWRRLGLVFENASSAVALVGEEKRASVYNYFIGSDASQWRAAVPAYANVLYRGIYEGVDVRVREAAERFDTTCWLRRAPI